VEIILSIVWTTKERQPLILPQQETDLYNYIIGKSNFWQCIIHEINGMSDHIHLIVSIPPKMAITEYVQKIKGSSSHYLGEINHNSFQWQKGYGVFSVGVKNLDIAVNYVKNQKQHHQNNTIISALEEIKNEDNAPQKYNK
jgi:putative transposase